MLATFDFDNQDLNGRAALVEGATLLLLRPDTLLEAIPLVEFDSSVTPTRSSVPIRPCSGPRSRCATVARSPSPVSWATWTC